MPTENTNPGNFANYPDKEVKAAASKGGKSGTKNKGFASENYNDEKQREAASKGGHVGGGSFQPGEARASEAGRKGGQS